MKINWGNNEPDRFKKHVNYTGVRAAIWREL